MHSDLNEPSPDYQRIGIGIVIGAVIVAAIWGAFAFSSGNSEEATETQTLPAGLSSLPRADSGTHPTHAEALANVCSTVFDTQGEALDAARRSMNQWEVHIEAMNKLVVGAITLDQATAFWDRTRVGAQRRLATFRSAYRDVDDLTVRCPPPRRAATSPAHACQQATAARTDVLQLADVALRTWRRHVHHMEMLRHGHITPAAATSEWLRSWREGNDQVRAYRAATRAAPDQTC